MSTQTREDRAPYVADLTADAGVTYRQLDYWVRAGHIHPQQSGDGSGHWRRYPLKEIRIARAIRRLLGTSSRPLLHLSTAAQLARRGPGRHRLAPGVIIEISADIYRP